MKKGTSTQHNIFKNHQTLHDEKQTRSKQARKHCYRTSIQTNQKKNSIPTKKCPLEQRKPVQHFEKCKLKQKCYGSYN